MNVTDLRDELTSHADDLGAAPDFRAGVAGRVRRTRRRRAAAACAATLAVAAVAAGVVTGTGRPAPAVPAGPPTSSASAAPMIGADGMPYRAVPDAPGDVVKDGLRYRAKVADDTLAVGFIGDPGQAQASLIWEPTTTHVSFGASCYLPGLSPDEASKYMVSVGLEGGKDGVFGRQCSGERPSERDLPSGGIPGEPGQGWDALTVGKAARLRVRLVDAKTMRPATVEGVQLSGAVYELGSEQPVRDPSGKTVASLPDVVEHQGYRYELIGLQAEPLASWHDLTSGVPAGISLFTWGSAGGDLPGSGTAESGIRLSGLPSGAEVRPYGSWGTAPAPDGSDHTVTVTTVGKRPDQGTGFLALYRLEH
ncbi:hypothetical protein [Terrabacter sp. NPDC080008]|uniref:hypothetical protein n=1 Tax=Terrabacter sp. NPDC080008 TaxID=3155176 RepID=UPI00344F4EE4